MIDVISVLLREHEKTGIDMSETRHCELDSIWVAVDYIRAGQIAGFRGRMASSDFEALIQGGFLPTFVLLEDVH